jgi:4-oxalocrotonate tautomerase
MPEVYLYAPEGRTVNQQRKIVQEIADVVARNFNVAPEAVLVHLIDMRRKGRSSVHRSVVKFIH